MIAWAFWISLALLVGYSVGRAPRATAGGSQDHDPPGHHHSWRPVYRYSNVLARCPNRVNWDCECGATRQSAGDF